LNPQLPPVAWPGARKTHVVRRLARRRKPTYHLADSNFLSAYNQSTLTHFPQE